MSFMQRANAGLSETKALGIVCPLPCTILRSSGSLLSEQRSFGRSCTHIPTETIDITPPQGRIAEPKPIDHRAIFQERLAGCTDATCTDTLWQTWQRTLARAEEAGKPISEDVQSDVKDMIAAKRAEFAQEHAAAPVDEVPA